MRTIGLLLMSTVLANAEPCQRGSAEVLALEQWRVDPSNKLFVDFSLALTLRSSSTKGIRMVDGTIWFTDALGASIGGVNLPRDLQIPAGGTVETTINVGGLTRLPALDRADVQTRLGICGAVFDDGSRQTF